MRTPADPEAVRELSIDVHRQGDRHRLSLQGELDLTSAAKLTGAVAGACAQGAREVVLDMGGLEFIDSTGLRAILNSRALCEERLCEFSLMPEPDKVRTQVRRVLEITGLIDKLPFSGSGAA